MHHDDKTHILLKPCSCNVVKAHVTAPLTDYEINGASDLYSFTLYIVVNLNDAVLKTLFAPLCLFVLSVTDVFFFLLLRMCVKKGGWVCAEIFSPWSTNLPATLVQVIPVMLPINQINVHGAVQAGSQRMHIFTCFKHKDTKKEEDKGFLKSRAESMGFTE